MGSARTLTIRDRAGALEATFAPGAGMVCSSLRADGEELLAQRGGLAAYVERGATFGIPLLYPWANRLFGWDYQAAGRRVELDPHDPLVHRDAARGIPMHGLLAASPHWQLIDADLDCVTAELDFAAVPDYLRSFPYPHRLTLTATVRGAALGIALTVTATGELPVPVSFGFHPYLTLPGTPREQWQLRVPRGGVESGSLGERAFDDAFTTLTGAPPVFAVADDRRRVAVEFTDGYPIAQVYTEPGADFVCFEPMTAPIDALRSGNGLRCVAPGEHFTASFQVAIT